MRALLIGAFFFAVTPVLVSIQWLLGKLGLPGWGFISSNYYRVLRALLRIDVRVAGAPIRDRAVLFVSNHVSWADIIVIGPGSLFTSILPSLLLPDIRTALAASPALKIYVCNVATQAGETDGFDLADNVEALERHTASGLVDVVLANNRTSPGGHDGGGREPVRLRWPPAGHRPARLVLDDLVDPVSPIHHDPERLAGAILRIAEREGAARRRSGVARSA